jgi:cell division protein FtsZ
MQALGASRAETRIQIGKKTSQGLGAGADPEVGEKCALEQYEEIKAAIKDAHMVIITAGMGGGTGTGAAPVVAKIAKDLGILVVAVVTFPFKLENITTKQQAVRGINKLKPHCDTLVIIPNERIYDIVDPNITLKESYLIIDDELRKCVLGISGIANTAGTNNIDFADIRNAIKERGTAFVGIGAASGQNRAIEAARLALHSKMISIPLKEAQCILVYIAAPINSFTLRERQQILMQINDAVGPNLKFQKDGLVYVNGTEEVTVTIVATGYDQTAKDSGKQDATEELLETEFEVGSELQIINHNFDALSNIESRVKYEYPEWIKLRNSKK